MARAGGDSNPGVEVLTIRGAFIQGSPIRKQLSLFLETHPASCHSDGVAAGRQSGDERVHPGGKGDSPKKAAPGHPVRAHSYAFKGL